MTLGIDVFQKYNTVTSWQQVRNGGVQDVYVKLTNGSAPASPTGDNYINGARAVGIRVGGYAYVTGASSPQAEADAFAAELIRLGATELPPALDYEDASVPNNSAARGWVEAFFAQLRAKTGLTEVVLYSSGSELNTIGAGSVNVPGLQIYIWDAEYGSNNGTEHPVTHYTGHVDVHQFTSVGHVAGINGNVDLDDFLTNLNSSNTEGFLMALTDAQQQQLYDAYFTSANAPYGVTIPDILQALLNGPDTRQLNARVASIYNGTATAGEAYSLAPLPAEANSLLNQVNEVPGAVWNQAISDGKTTNPAGAWLVDKNPNPTVTVDQATLQAALTAAGVPTAEAVAAAVLASLTAKLEAN